MEFFPALGQRADFKGAKLLLPGVTFANVGQLAIDLIISTLQLPCVGQFETALVLPSAGNGAFDHHAQQVAVSLGLFECPVEDGQSVFVLQQRAPAVKGCQKQFAEELVKWASQEKFSQVVVIASLDATLRRDRQIAVQQVYVAPPDSCNIQICQSLDWQQLEDPLLTDLQQQQSLLPPWTYLEALKQHEVHHTCIILFAAEGNNTPDAMRLADASNKYLHLLVGSLPSSLQTQSNGVASSIWAPPSSWKYVYGSMSSRGYY